MRTKPRFAVTTDRDAPSELVVAALRSPLAGALAGAGPPASRPRVAGQSAGAAGGLALFGDHHAGCAVRRHVAVDLVALTIGEHAAALHAHAVAQRARAIAGLGQDRHGPCAVIVS